MHISDKKSVTRLESNTCIDHVLTNKIEKNICIQYVDYSEFDHKLMFLELLNEKIDKQIKNTSNKFVCIDYNKIECNILLNVKNVMSNLNSNIHIQ